MIGCTSNGINFKNGNNATQQIINIFKNMPAPPRETIKPFYESNYQLLKNFSEDLSAMKLEPYYREMPEGFKVEVDNQLTLIESLFASIVTQINILDEIG